jgi:hypothetical protein
MKSNEHNDERVPILIPISNKAECARYSDKYIDSALSKVEEGVKNLQMQYPGM